MLKRNADITIKNVKRPVNRERLESKLPVGPWRVSVTENLWLQILLFVGIYLQG